jgi:hypothetical protein
VLDLWRQKASIGRSACPFIETRSNAAARGDLDTVIREYAFPDVHIGAGEDESPYVGLPKISVIPKSRTSRYVTSLIVPTIMLQAEKVRVARCRSYITSPKCRVKPPALSG